MRRGEIWWGSLPAPVGGAPGFRRPVLIIQSDDFNLSSIRTVVVAGVTSNLSRAEAPATVQISQRESGLPRPSVVNLSQLITIDRSLLTEQAGALPSRRMQDIDFGLRLVLDLTSSS